MKVGHLIFIALVGSGCSNSATGQCSGFYHCPAIGHGETLPLKLVYATSFTTEPPCQVMLTPNVPRFFSASLPAGTTMATCPLHVHFSDKPDLDSTITITYLEFPCCGSGWSFTSPLFYDQAVQPDASRAETSDVAEGGELGDVSWDQQTAALDAADASIE
jgi:hypothetical protein